MAMEERSRNADAPHRVDMDMRSRLSVTGVQDVESFDDGEIMMYTSQGPLLVRGENLRIEILSLDSGQLEINGRVDSLEYQQESVSTGGFWSKVFG